MMLISVFNILLITLTDAMDIDDVDIDAIGLILVILMLMISVLPITSSSNWGWRVGSCKIILSSLSMCNNVVLPALSRPKNKIRAFLFCRPIALLVLLELRYQGYIGVISVVRY